MTHRPTVRWTLSASDQHNTSQNQNCSRATPGVAAHTSEGWTEIESSFMRLFAFRCPRLHNNRPVVALPLRWRRQHPISVVEKVLATVVVETTAEAESAPLPISVESIRLYFFKKKYEEELREGENSYPPVCSTTTVTWRPGKNINLIRFTFFFTQFAFISVFFSGCFIQ